MILFFVALLVVPLSIIFGGLAVDLAAVGTLKDRLQVAADAGATAGASAFHFVKDDRDCLAQCAGHWAGSPLIASSYAEKNGYQADVLLDPTVPAVTVTTAAHIPTSFLRLLGIFQLSSAARAKAIRYNIAQSDKDAEPPIAGRSRLVQ